MHVTKILNFIFLTHYNKIGISWMKSIYVNERQGENQMAVFGNVQKLPFAFFPLSSHIISQHDLYLILPFFGCRSIGLAYDFQIIPSVPTADHDVNVHRVIFA